MKVQGPGRPGAVDSARGASSPKGTEAAKESGGERVRMSQQVILLQDARKPEVPDAALVARLREAISKGAFEVDPHRIADLMMTEESE